MTKIIASSLLGIWIYFAVPDLISAAPSLPNINTNNIVVITNSPFNAVGDGTNDNTLAISNAIVVAAAGGTTNSAAGGTVEIPPGIYLSGPLMLKSSVNLQIDAGAILRMLPLGLYPGGTNTGTTFISGSNLHDIEISGSGAIDGQGAAWWPYSSVTGANRPRMISPSNCNRLLIQNVTLSNSPMFHIAISGSSSGNTTVQGVTIFAPGNSPNTDACDVDGTNILVQNCNISEGDDDFTCGGGTSGVLLINNTYGTGHGISIGSYTDGGVSNITVINCTMNGTVNGIRIKSDNDRGGLVQNISYSNIGMTNVDFPIQIYAYYNEIGTPSSISPYYAATQAVAAVTSLTPIYRNITFSNITATSVSGYPIGILWARTEMPATNIVFNKVNITGNRNFCLYNVSGAQFIDCNLKPSATSNTFAMFNAQVIVTNSAPTNTLFTFAGLTTNGYGNGFTFNNAQASTKSTNTFGAGPLALAASTFIVSNSLTLFPATALNYALGTNTAKLAVVGNLVLGGTVNVTGGVGFTNGAYTLMTYTGNLSGSPPALGSAPAGYNYAFDISIAGQVNLDVSATALMVPAAPSNLVATAGNQLVTLTWSPSATATNYNVKRSTTGGGPYTSTNKVTATGYSDTQVANGTTYYYVVSAVNAAGESTNSAEVLSVPQASQSTGGTANVFNDVFPASTVNSSSSASPTATATSYEVLSSKAWNPTPGITAGHLQFGIGSTSSGCIEVQALFTNPPVTLANVGDTLSLTVTFTNTSGLLTQSGAMGFGLYNSGQNFPVPGGLNGTATSSSTGNATGNAQTWMGYVGQLAFTGSSSQILTRPPQTGTANNNQDAMTTGSSASYSNPAGSTVGTASTAPSVTLVAGNPYTEFLTITLTATNTLAITNFLYSGVNTNGALLSQFGALTAGGNYLTNSFDALAVGWRETGSQATAIDINQITVNATFVASVPPVSLIPTNIVCQVVGGQLQLSWPQDHLGWRLQIQTNDLSGGLGTNWVTVPNSTNVNSMNIIINPTNGSVFLRQVYP